MLHIDYKSFANIRGEIYRRMVSTAMKFSDAVMLVYYDSNDHPMPDSEREIRAMLSPYLLASRNNGETTPEHPCFTWPGTRTGYRDPTDPAEKFYSGDSRIYVDTYELTDFVKDVILSADAFTDWLHSKGRPTDICFFKENACWFETTVHEGMLGMDDYEDAFFEILHEGGIEYTYYSNWQSRGRRYREEYELG